MENSFIVQVSDIHNNIYPDIKQKHEEVINSKNYLDESTQAIQDNKDFVSAAKADIELHKQDIENIKVVVVNSKNTIENIEQSINVVYNNSKELNLDTVELRDELVLISDELRVVFETAKLLNNELTPKLVQITKKIDDFNVLAAKYDIDLLGNTIATLNEKMVEYGGLVDIASGLNIGTQADLEEALGITSA